MWAAVRENGDFLHLRFEYYIYQLSFLRSVILFVCTITAKVISRFH